MKRTDFGSVFSFRLLLFEPDSEDAVDKELVEDTVPNDELVAAVLASDATVVRDRWI